MDGKKISFGFKSKLKPQIIQKVPIVKKNDIELIECVEKHSIKIIGKEDLAPTLLVIPMKEDNNATRLKASMAKILMQEELGIVEETSTNIDINKNNKPIENGEVLDSSKESLEQRAAREIIQTLKTENVVETTKVYTLPLKPEDLPLDGAKESTLDDYDSIPIQDFGLALLRGMGWKDESKPKDGLKLPELRPKGMGLGADKISKPKNLLVQPAQNEVLELKKNAYVKIVAGKYKDLYGQIEGFDDDSGRIFIKLTIGGVKASLNEFMIQIVSKEEWTRYSKVLNSAKYEEYKNKDQERNESNNYKIKIEPTSSSSRIKQRNLSKSPEPKQKTYNATSFKNDENSSNDEEKDHHRKNNSSKYSKNNLAHEEGRSRRKIKYKSNRHKKSYSSTSGEDDDEESSEYEDRKKSSHKSHRNKSRNRSRSRSYDDRRRYSSDDEKHHKKKTKKSKKPRSRSRTRR